VRVFGLQRRSFSRARVITPNWPSVERTASNTSLAFTSEQTTTSPVPVTTSSSVTLSPWAPYRKDATPSPATDSVPPIVTPRLLVRTGGTTAC